MRSESDYYAHRPTFPPTQALFSRFPDYDDPKPSLVEPWSCLPPQIHLERPRASSRHRKRRPIGTKSLWTNEPLRSALQSQLMQKRLSLKRLPPVNKRPCYTTQSLNSVLNELHQREDRLRRLIYASSNHLETCAVLHYWNSRLPDGWTGHTLHEVAQWTQTGPLHRIADNLVAAIAKSLSVHERAGVIYCYRVLGPPETPNAALFKVGRTGDYDRRKREWELQCPSQTQQWFVAIPVKYSHLTGGCLPASFRFISNNDTSITERLIHLTLHEICLRRPRKKCEDCWTKHQEIFELMTVPGVRTYEDVILPIIREMAWLASTGARF
ncbi:hypothetical protein V5O48_018623 [Marasmius crinis-equi]|uniref:Bacteriophage T5 Orf172 DNA-binding domain-containing protein n=1 Tax=Marasmius crinis-equi TaxID=585013 RepID=A0ABR3EKP4_9AGAR